MNPGFSLIGARTDLGLSIRWRFSFLDAGSVVSRSSDAVYLDVGGHLEPGVLDHHQGSPGATSAARLVFTHPDLVHEHLVGPWIAIARTQEVRSRNWSPTIGLHAAPDFDALVSTALAMELVETGRFPRRAAALVDYTDRVDQGAERPPLPEQRFDLYPLILMLQNLPGDPSARRRAGMPDEMPTREDLARAALLAGVPEDLQARWRDLDERERTLQRLSEWSRHPHASAIAAARFDELTVRLGLHLIRAWLDLGADALSRDPMANVLAEALELDTERFRVAAGRLKPLAVALPSVDLTAPPIERVDAAVLPLAPRDSVDQGAVACDKIYLRGGMLGLDRRFPVTMIEKPRSGSVGDDPPRARWIIAIDEASPPSELEARANLRGLGASLEWAEQRRRDALGLGATRRGASRFPEFPGIADPWYDGRGHHWTIIDSPREGTVLGERDLVDVLASRFWEPEIASPHAEAWRRRGDCDEGGTRGDGDPAARRETIPMPSPSGLDSPLRFGEAIGAATRAARELGTLYALLVVHPRKGWDETRLRHSMRELIGGTPEPLALSIGEAYVGPSACVVLIEREGEAFSADRSLDRLFALVEELRGIDAGAKRIGEESRRDTTIGLCQRLRERYVKASAGYRGRDPESSVDHRLLQTSIEQALGLDARLAATGQLIEHLHEESERSHEGQLNRIVFVLALFGIFEAIIAGLGTLESAWIESDAACESFHRWWSVGVLGLSLVLVAVAITLPTRVLDRHYARIPLLGPLLFPELQRPGRDRRRHDVVHHAASTAGVDKG